MRSPDIRKNRQEEETERVVQQSRSTKIETERRSKILSDRWSSSGLKGSKLVSAIFVFLAPHES